MGVVRGFDAFCYGGFWVDLVFFDFGYVVFI